MKQKKLVFLFRDMGTGGAQKIEAFVANTMLEEGDEVVVVNMSSTPCTVNINKNIQIVDLVYDDVEKCKNKILKLIYKFLYLLRLRKTLLLLKPDAVCAFLSDVVRMTVLAIGNSSIPIIGSERGDPFTFSERQFENYKKAYEKCNTVVFQLEAVAHKYDLPMSVRQRIVPNPCIPRKETYQYRSSITDKVIISAGRLASQKRFDLLIDAFSIVHETFPEYRLVIYGDGPLKEQLMLQAQATSAKEAITFAGDVDDVFAIAANADFFVLSSDYEGIPNVLIEAMAIGMPCVSTDCSPGGARYLLMNGERGIVVPRDDKEELAKAMMAYMSNPELRDCHSKKCVTVKEEFSPQTIMEMWVEVFNKI